MAPLFPIELLQSLNRQCPCREIQLRQLATLLSPTSPNPSTLVAYGLENTCKLKAATCVLNARSIPYVLVKSRECLSQRHLLSKIFAAFVTLLDQTGSAEHYDKIDSIKALAVNLQNLLRDREQKYVLVLDGIDRQRGASLTLLPALARLGDITPNLSVFFISSSPRPLLLHKSGVPYIYFPPYSRNQAIALLSASGPPPRPHVMPLSTVETGDEVLKKIYLQFIATVYDSLIAPTSSSSLTVFRAACERLWPRFIWPYLSEEAPPGRNKKWDFGTLYVRNRLLFQISGESALVEKWRQTEGAWTFEALQASQAQPGIEDPKVIPPVQPQLSKYHTPTSTLAPTTLKLRPPLLKHFATLLLVSAYLASHTHPKVDIVLFSRISSGSKSHKIRRRKHFTAKSTSKTTSSTSAKSPSSKSLFDAKFGLARPFTLERVTAILRAVHPQGVSGRRGMGDRVYREMAELERLRLVCCVGGVAGEDGEERWRVNVGRELVEGLGGSWGVGMRDYELEQ